MLDSLRRRVLRLDLFASRRRHRGKVGDTVRDGRRHHRGKALPETGGLSLEMRIVEGIGEKARGAVGR